MVNPFRTGSKLGRIYDLISDGSTWSVTDLTDDVYFYGASDRQLLRRRVSSALRTIRCLPGVSVEFDDNKYCMKEMVIRAGVV